MPPPPANALPLPSREEQARREIGVTDVRRPVAATLTGLFLLLLAAGLAAVPASRTLRHDLTAAWRGGGTPAARIGRLEKALDASFPAARRLRIPVQTALCALGNGDEQVFVGRHGWLNYAPDVSALTAPSISDPRRRRSRQAESPVVIRAFGESLAARGIRLVVLPVPAKPGVHPEGLGGAAGAAPLRVPGYAAWSHSLRGYGVDVLDAAPALQAARLRNGAAYLRGDTHWTPEALEAVAAALAANLRPNLPPWPGAVPRELLPRTVTQVGDTAQMLALAADHPLRQPETVTIRPVAGARSDTADVLLLGDSFANIYALDEMGWGADAGFPDRLALHLGRPVRAFVRNADGAWGSRDRLLRALERGEASLADVRVVVWQFAERELVHGNWARIAPELPAEVATPAPAPAGTPHQAAWTCSGLLSAVSNGPRLDAPYSEFILKWHVTALQGGPSGSPPEAVVLLPGMRQRRILPAAALRPGRRLALRLRPWREVEARYGSLNAGSLDDPMLEIDLPLFWAEEAAEEEKP